MRDDPVGRVMKAPEHPGDELGTLAARGVAWSAVGQWGDQAVSLVVFVVLARLLEPSAFGLLAMAGVVVALARALASGFPDAVVQRFELTQGVLDSAFWGTLILGSAAAAAVSLTAPLAAALFGAPELRPVLVAMSVTVPIAALGSTHQAILRRQMEFRPIAELSLAAAGIAGVVAIVVALGGGGVWALVWQAVVHAAVTATLLWRAADWRPSLHLDPAELREVAKFARNIIGANVVNFFNRYSDDLVIGAFLGPVALGYYTIAYRLLWASTRALSGIASAVALPAFSRLQRTPDRFRQAFLGALELSALVAFPLYLGMAVLAPELTVTLFGPDWGPAAPILRVLAGIGLLHALTYIDPPALTAAGRPDWVLKVNVVNAVLNVIAFIIAVRWGVLAVAAAYTIRGYVTWPIPLHALKQVLGLRLRRYARQLAGAAGAAGIMTAAVLGLAWLVGGEPYQRLLVCVPGGAAIYVGALTVLHRRGVRRLLDAFRQIWPAQGLEGAS